VLDVHVSGMYKEEHVPVSVVTTCDGSKDPNILSLCDVPGARLRRACVRVPIVRAIVCYARVDTRVS